MAAKPPTRIARRATNRTADYSLARCEGYRVLSDNGRLGTVLGIRFDPGTGALAGLRVRTGLLRRHTLIMPITDVIGIEPQHHLVYVRAGTTPAQMPDANGKEQP